MIIDVIVLYFLLASIFPLGRVAVQSAQPIFFTGIRMMLAGIILVVYFYFRHPQQFRQYVKLRYFKLLLVLTIFNVYLTNVLEFWGLQALPAAKACFIYNLSPFFAALFSYFLFSERMTMKKWIGMLVGFLGFLPILMHTATGETVFGGISFLSWAEIAVLCAAIATAFGWTVMRHSILVKGYPIVLANGISMLMSSIAIIPTSLLLEQWKPLPIFNYEYFLFSLIAIVVISNLISYNIYGFLLKKYTATFLSFAGFMSPLFTAVMGWLFLGETVSWYFFVSVATVFLGLSIFYQEELRLGYIIYSSQR